MLRDLVFWANWLGAGKIEFEISTGGPPLRVSASPAQGEARVGIQGDEVKIGALIEQGTFTVDQVAAESGEGIDDEPEVEGDNEDES